MVLFGAPFDLCGFRLGARLGPAAFRLAGVDEALARLGHKLDDRGDILATPQAESKRGIKHVNTCVDGLLRVRDSVAETLSKGDFPIVVGGDHSLGLGTVAGAQAAFGDDVAVLWVDAHGDINTPATSPSGNLHGMSFGAILGLESGVEGKQDEDWQKFRGVMHQPLRPSRAGWLGLREIDDGERLALRNCEGSYIATMHDLDRHGMDANLDRLDKWLDGIRVKHLWISFDVDCLDPILAPGTGTAVHGGLTYREMHLMAELLCEHLERSSYKLCGLDIVEINPLFDKNNETARTAVEWVASVFGKRIL